MGVLVGILGFCVYAFTVEPTASFWDCGEFIAVSYKLEVPHPPGAPLYLLIGRLFSMLAGSDVEQVAYWVNMLSVLCSALTLMFLFWTLTLLMERVVQRKAHFVSSHRRFIVMASGLVGSLTYMFSDTFWFSAVEAEVYAMSSLFTAVIIWAILRWERLKDPQQESRWLLFIAYMIGLSIGVHLLGLIALPALSLVYYYKHYARPSPRGALVALGLGFLVIAGIMVGLIQGLPTLALSFDVFFVNHLHLPFRSGAIFFFVLLVGGLVSGLYFAHRHGHRLWQTALLGLSFILIGYASYLLVLIRSTENPPLDENNPENIISFLSYLKREQYGDRPLLYGRNFTARLLEQKKGSPIYAKGKDRYEVVDYEVEPVYDPKDMTLFPRMYSATSESQRRNYQRMSGLSPGQKPNLFHNIRYFLSYQLGHMYFRYFLWNFAGREHDEQHASWLSPFDALEEVPQRIAQNEGRNNYLMLPLALGLLGLFFQYGSDFKHFFFVLVIFVLAGIGIIVYLNMPPAEPRERDYIFSGSFYAFSIWAGFSFPALYEWLSQHIRQKRILLGLVSCLCLIPPLLMAKENWDDHDRSGRYFSVDTAINLLESCEPNAILFTGGDNDTFPLWYAQEVEGIRTDVRVIVLSYFNTDWYIAQMMRPAYESAPIPFGLSLESYRQGGPNDFLPVDSPEGQDAEAAIHLQKFLQLIAQDDARIRILSQSGGSYNSVPSEMFAITVDTAQVRRKGLVPKEFDSLLQTRLYVPIKGSYLEKKDLAILDMIVENAWERPIYFNHTSLAGIGIRLDPHVVQVGMAFRLLPVWRPSTKPRDYLVQTDEMYRIVKEKFSFRGLQDASVYYSEDYRNFVLNHRAILLVLINSLLKEGKEEKAKEMLLYTLDHMPHEVVPYDHYNSEMVGPLLEVGETQRAMRVADIIAQDADEMIDYLKHQRFMDDFELKRNLFMLSELNATFRKYEEDSLAQKYERMIARHIGEL